MDSYFILGIIISLSAFFAYINHRYIKLPFVIGIFLLSSLLSVLILSSKFWASNYFIDIKKLILEIDISRYVLEYMLGYLLFAGSLHTEWSDIKKQLKPITIFSIFGVLVSTFIIGILLYCISNFFSLQIAFIYCLIFGALISPTDPIAVLGILTKANVPKKIESVIVGESLFNDGIGVVVFISLLEILKTGNIHFEINNFGVLFIRESIGGIAFGLLAGYVLKKIIESIDHYETETLLTIAFVMMGYSLCLKLHISGALAMVVLGLFVGNYSKNQTMSDITIDYIDKFWELVDVVLNAILFIIISFVLVVIEFRPIYLLVGLLAVIITLFSRFVIIYLPKIILPKTINLTSKESNLIVWGGLRGGLSLAMVLSLPNSETKNILLIATYTCVVFSILVQGLTIGRMAKR